jgi:hypothetical protein
MVSGGHNSREIRKKEKTAYENKETIFEHPAQHRAGAGDDAGDEFDGVCGRYHRAKRLFGT